MDAPTPRPRYARLEREQRWVARLPRPESRRHTEIVDRYLTGTRLRVRRMESAEGVVCKLAQKIRVHAGDPGAVWLTNIYITEGEHEILARLDGAELRKTRSWTAVAGRSIAVDRFRGPLEGLVLAEVELDANEPRLPAPAFAMVDVSDDDRFSGARLAHMTADETRRLLDEVRRLAE